VRKRDPQLSRFDPTGEVNLENPAAVELAIKAILDRIYGASYDAALLAPGIDALVQAHRGRYPGLLRCDTLYHDLRHALETGLTMARLLEAHAKSLPAGTLNDIDGGLALLGILLALFHDVGLLRRDAEAHLQGAVLTPIHEERGVEFMRHYLAETALSPLAEKAELIMPTKLVFRIPDTWPRLDRKIASMVATADMLSQLADCCYLEKCWHFLYEEFRGFGVAGTPDSAYPDRETLMAKSSGFYANMVVPRLEQEFSGMHRLMDSYYCGSNPYQESIASNFNYLANTLLSRDFSRLRRRPRTFIGDPAEPDEGPRP
jgi:hypothetical protein